ARPPRPVDYIDVDDLKALPSHKSGKKAMQPVKVGHHQKYLPPERLQSAARITRPIFQDRATDRVRRPRLEFLETSILSSNSLARGEADALAALFERRNQLRQEGRIVLTVAVEGSNERAARGAHAAPYGS